jgi:kumamolisin
MNLTFRKPGLATLLLATLAAPIAYAGAPAAHDLGKFTDREGDQSITLTIALKLSDLSSAESLMQRVATPGDSLYRKFMTAQQVGAQFGPSDADVAQVTTVLQAAGLSVERATLTTLAVTGRVSALENTFGTSLHEYSVEASGRAPAYTYRTAATAPVIPASIASVVHGVLGFSTRIAFHPHFHQLPPGVRPQSPNKETTNTINAPGDLTVVDFAQLYDVNPLYNAGITGAGSTIGIVTLASFTHTDPFRYWESLNLNVDANRIRLVKVDGGSGPPSDAAGSEETALDIEQSGGIAPGAKIIVYETGGSNQAFVDAFARAVADNKADSISTSFGSWEFFNSEQAGATATDPTDGETVSVLQALHDVLVVAGLQGQSVFAAAGDCGAFDSFDELPSNFSTPLSVDYPGSDSALTSSGGTTLPGVQTFPLPNGGTFSIDVPKERVWGWDYLEPLCVAEGLSLAQCQIFPTGGGGGISVFFPIPGYQQGIAGTQRSQPGQKLVDNSTTPPTVDFVLPANFAGRNVPDVTFNADPDTGYVVFYTSDGTTPGMAAGFGEDPFVGGTSFVGPQLNGVTALLVQALGGRVGLLNPALYQTQRLGLNSGSNPVIKTIKQGDNWFFDARDGYSPASGLGDIDVTNFAEVLQ